MPVTHTSGTKIGMANGRRVNAQTRWSKKFDAFGVINLARERSKQAILKLEKLMNGDAGTIKVMNPKTGELMTVPVEVPATVQAKCAELIIERAYGKSPQAILVDDGKNLLQDRTLTVAEKIVALQQAREAGPSTDLEASEITEVDATPALALPEPAPNSTINPLDLI